MKSTLSWPLAVLPRPVVAGSFAHRDRGFPIAYRIRHLAVHLYEYAADMRLGTRQIALRPGDLTCTPPGVESRYHLPRPGRHWCVHVAVAAADDGPRLQLPLHLRLGPSATMARDRLVRVIDHHRRAQGEAGGVSATAAAAAMLELLCWLAGSGGPAEAGTRGEAAVARAAELIRARPAATWRDGQLAREVGLSPAYLARRFRRRYGHTLARFQLVQRIGAAQALLACTDRAVGDIGREVGIADPHHFNKLFRAVAGQPPSAFRAAHRG